MNEQEEKPPFFDSWNKMYGVVIANLVVLMVLFFTFAKVFE